MGSDVIAMADRRLNSWKEIGTFFGRDERTVKRWEATRGLPVRRVPGPGGTKVFGYVGELTEWLNSGGKPRPAYGTVLSAVDAPRRARRATRGSRPQARELTLAGMYYSNLLTPDATSRALRYFTEALVVDPDDAAAHVGLGSCYTQLRRFGLVPDADAYARAKTAAERAIALEPLLPEAHSLLGVALFYGSWQVADALAAFERALAADPQSWQTHHRYAMALLHMGRFASSLNAIDVAQAINPVYRPVLADKGRILFHAGRQADSVALLTELAAVAPEFMSVHAYLAIVHLAQGDHARYLAAAARAELLRGESRRRAVFDAGRQGLARDGVAGMARAMLAQQQQLYARGVATAFDLAEMHAVAGDTTVALDLLRLSVQRHESAALNLVIDPAFAALHAEAAFRDLVDSLGFELAPP